jgi:hypothetical protein
LHTGEFPTPPGLPALAPGEAFSEAIREVAREIGAYRPTETDAARAGSDRLPVDTRDVLRIAAHLARELWKRGARLLE